MVGDGKLFLFLLEPLVLTTRRRVHMLIPDWPYLHNISRAAKQRQKKAGYIHRGWYNKTDIMVRMMVKTFLLHVNEAISNLTVPGSASATSMPVVVFIRKSLYSRFIH